MPGSGRAPKLPGQRRTRHKPSRGEWQATPGIGWQHGPIPDPPTGLGEAARITWETWLRAWFASHWTPDDLPGLGLVIVKYDAVVRSGSEARANDLTVLVRLMDTYGITPAGQQSRRWLPPKAEPEAPPVVSEAPGMKFAQLRVVAE